LDDNWEREGGGRIVLTVGEKTSRTAEGGTKKRKTRVHSRLKGKRMTGHRKDGPANRRKED